MKTRYCKCVDVKIAGNTDIILRPINRNDSFCCQHTKHLFVISSVKEGICIKMIPKSEIINIQYFSKKNLR